MEAEAEKGRLRRRRRRLDEVVPGGRIPEDVVALILSYLPLKSLGRFKSVSSAWCVLIQTLNLPPLFPGFFYAIVCQSLHINYNNFDYDDDDYDDDDYDYPGYPEKVFKYIAGGSEIIDPALSFLRNVSNFYNKVVDSCNGLLLISQPHSPDLRFFICNPLTKSWTRLYGLADFARLDFDPKVSPNLKIVSFPYPGTPKKQLSVLMIRVLSSENKTKWKHYEPVKFRDPSDRYVLMSRHRYNYHALWGGSLYLSFGSGVVKFGDAGRIMRFDLLEDHVADGQLIELPKGTKKPIDVAIGRSKNKLCLAGLDWININIDINNNNNNYYNYYYYYYKKNNNHHHQMVPRLRVWSLSNRDQTVWVMEHDSVINSLPLQCHPEDICERTSAVFCQFHPFLDVVYILYRSMVYAYDLKNPSLKEICRIGSNKWDVTEASFFPYLPSMVDNSIQSKTKHRGKTSLFRHTRRRISATSGS